MSWENFFWSEGLKIMEHDKYNSSQIGLRRFREFFGVSPLVCQEVWKLIRNKIPSGANAKHVLWTLLFLKRYNTESVNRKICGCDEKSYRKWIWVFIDIMSELDVVRNITFINKSV
jgi:hypothetical protein